MHTYTRGTYAAFGLLFGAFLAASVEHGGLLLGNQRLAKLNRAGEVQKYVSGNLSRSSRRLRTALHGTRGHTFLASESRMRTHVQGTCTPRSTVRVCSHVGSSSTCLQSRWFIEYVSAATLVDRAVLALR